MHYFILPSKDATIYNDNPNENTGLDQIIELEKQLIDDIPRNSRILFTSASIPSSPSCFGS